VTLFGDLSESEATGQIAEIFAEIRYFGAVPYVSSLQRQLATVPGCLEWLWDAIRPAFADGRLPEAAWAATKDLNLPQLFLVPHEALRSLGVDREGEASLHDIYETFLRASPVNMATAGTLRYLLDAAPSDVATVTKVDAVWTPPPPPSSLPAFPSTSMLGPEGQNLLALFAVDINGASFVPGLYRFLAHWPAYLAHVAVELLPLFGRSDIVDSCHDVVRRVDEMMPTVTEGLVAGTPPFDAKTANRLRGSLSIYQGTTSPQMIVFSTLLREALPAA